MLTVALTGGIGCGKSAVSHHLKTLGVPIIDADELSHQLVKPGAPALLEIQAAYGNNILNNQGNLDRAALRKIVFNEPQQRKILEDILHPRIRAAMENWLKNQNAKYVVLVIPLLFETDQMSLADRILVVDCDESVQIERVLKRDKLSIEQANLIIASQVNRQIRLKGADDIIENNSTQKMLLDAVNRIHKHYLKLAS